MGSLGLSLARRAQFPCSLCSVIVSMSDLSHVSAIHPIYQWRRRLLPYKLHVTAYQDTTFFLERLRVLENEKMAKERTDFICSQIRTHPMCCLACNRTTVAILLFEPILSTTRTPISSDNCHADHRLDFENIGDFSRSWPEK